MSRIINIVGGVACGMALSQVPEFSQQYEQRLGGAVDELRIVIADFDATAAAAGLTRAEALQRYADTNDDFLDQRGRDMERTFARYARLSAHLEMVQSAGPVTRLTGMATYLDPELAARTYDNYAPAVPVHAEGIAYAGVGVFGGYGLVAGLVALLTAPFRRRKTA